VLIKDVIPQLYFDQAEGEDSSDDFARVKNELESIKVTLQQKENDRSEIVNARARAETKLVEQANVVSGLQADLNSERTVNTGLKKELRSVKTRITEAEAAKLDAANVRKKLEGLIKVQDVVNECSSTVDNMLAANSDVRHLATWCAVLKKELGNKKKECKGLKDSMEEYRKELLRRKAVMRDCTTELQKLRDLHGNHNEDVKCLERQNASLKNKIDTLTRTNADLNSTMNNRYINESPAPASPARKKCRRKSMFDNLMSSESSMDTSNEILASSLLNADDDVFNLTKGSPSVQRKKDCREYGTQFLKISNIASTAAMSKKSKSVTDVTNMPGVLSSFNMFKKTGAEAQQSIVFRQGYNGLGMKETYIQPTGRPLCKPMKPIKKSSIFKPRMTSSLSAAPAPPLPKLDLNPSSFKFKCIDKSPS